MEFNLITRSTIERWSGKVRKPPTMGLSLVFWGKLAIYFVLLVFFFFFFFLGAKATWRWWPAPAVVENDLSIFEKRNVVFSCRLVPKPNVVDLKTTISCVNECRWLENDTFPCVNCFVQELTVVFYLEFD